MSNVARDEASGTGNPQINRTAKAETAVFF
jgi:hypothetical protein